MVIPEELLQRPGIELAVLGQLEGDLREPVGLPCRVEPEDIRCRLGGPDVGVQHRGEEKEIQRHDQREQREPGEVGDAVDAPFRTPPVDGPGEPDPEHGESGQEDERREDQELVDVVQHVMPHLVAHDRFDLGQRGAPEQVVVERDPLGAEQPRDVGADPGGLPRGIHHVHPLRGDSVGVCHPENRFANPRIAQERVPIEERGDENRADQRPDHQEPHRHGRPQRGPAPREAAKYFIEHRDRDAPQDQRDAQPDELVPHPPAQGLRGQPVRVLAYEPGVHGEREAQQKHAEGEQRVIQEAADQPGPGPPLGPVPHPPRPAGVEEQQHDGGREQDAPELDPVAALGVRVGARPEIGRHGGEIGPGGHVGIERHARLDLRRRGNRVLRDGIAGLNGHGCLRKCRQAGNANGPRRRDPFASPSGSVAPTPPGFPRTPASPAG